MNRRAVLFARVFVLVGALFAAGSLAACSDELEGGGACPIACPTPDLELRDTVITSGIVIDTSFAGFPPLGSESYLLLASLLDTLDTRVVVRYDTLPTNFTHVGTGNDSTIKMVDSARVDIHVLPVDTMRAAPFTIEVYDVDTTATDTLTAPILALFRPDRLLGQETFEPTDTLSDTLRVPISNAFLLAHILDSSRVRLGFRVVSSAGIQLRVQSSGGLTGFTPRISFRATTDTQTARVLITARSKTPVDKPFIRDPLADYVVPAIGTLAPSPNFLTVGGYPGAETYMRFDIPRYITDSSTVVRASLVLTQAPYRTSPSASDSLLLTGHIILAGNTVTDLTKALTFASTEIALLKVVPADSGERRIELVQALRAWRGVDPALTPRAIAIRSPAEGVDPAAALFFSREAGAAVQPRLELTFVPRINLGLP